MPFFLTLCNYSLARSDSKDFPVHTLDNPGGVAFRKMRVSLNHLQGFVSEHLRNFQERRPIHGQAAGAGMPQVVKAKVHQGCGFYSLSPVDLKLERLARSVCFIARKDQPGIYAPNPGMFLKKLKGKTADRNPPSFLVLGVVENDNGFG